jgi:hypothetical protein
MISPKTSKLSLVKASRKLLLKMCKSFQAGFHKFLTVNFLFSVGRTNVNELVPAELSVDETLDRIHEDSDF